VRCSTAQQYTALHRLPQARRAPMYFRIHYCYPLWASDCTYWHRA